MAAMGASCSPARPTVAAPATKTRAMFASRARRRTNSTSGPESRHGVVFGMQQTLVNPPAIAAAAPVAPCYVRQHPIAMYRFAHTRMREALRCSR